MFRTRRELFEARIENARLQLEVEALRRQVNQLDRVLGQVQAAMAAKDTEAVTLRERAHEAEKRAEVFKDRLDLVANHLPQAPSQRPLSMDEGAEDLEYAFAAGLINKAELEAELEAAGLLSSDIELVPSNPQL